MEQGGSQEGEQILVRWNSRRYFQQSQRLHGGPANDLYIARDSAGNCVICVENEEEGQTFCRPLEESICKAVVT
jgi:hypothetical protein